MIDFDTLVNAPCMQVFGEAAVHTAPGYLSQAVTGVFDEAYLAVTPLGDVGRDIGMPADINEKQPMLGVRLAQFVRPPQQGDAIKIVRTNTVYIIREVQPDGHGAAKLLMNLAP